jgi:O-6-methylguanine DNA methyltransferase
MHCYSKSKTNLYTLWVGFSSKGISMIRISENDPAAFEAAYEKRFGIRPRGGNLPESYGRAVQAAVAGRPFNHVPIDFSGLPEFEAKVLKLLQKIPRGEVRSYAWLARKAGRPKAARAVGNAMAHNPIPFLLPCHRVVPATGGVGNYGFGSALKRELLLREGAHIDKIEHPPRK